MRISTLAQTKLDKLPQSLSKKASVLLDEVAADPSAGRRLVGPLEGKRSIDLGRTHRIVYMVQDGEVCVLAVVSRRDSYR